MGKQVEQVAKIKYTTLAEKHPSLTNKAQKERGQGNGRGHEEFQLMYNRSAPYPSKSVSNTIYDLPKYKYSWA